MFSQNFVENVTFPENKNRPPQLNLELSPKTNVEMMKAYLNPVLGPEVSLIYESKILQ